MGLDEIKVYQAAGSIIPIFTSHEMTVEKTLESSGYTVLVGLTSGDDRQASGSLVVDSNLKSKTSAQHERSVVEFKYENYFVAGDALSHGNFSVHLENGPATTPWKACPRSVLGIVPWKTFPVH